MLRRIGDAEGGEERTMADEAARLGFACVHGAGLGGWVWDELEPLLDHPMLRADLPGRDEPAEVRRDLRLREYAEQVLAQVQAWDAEGIVLVAHSLGGVVALKVAERLGKRLAGFVGVSAAIPRGGGSFVSSLPQPQRLITGVAMRLAGTKPPASAIRKRLCSDLPAEQTAEVVRRFVPESRAVYVDRTDVTAPDGPKLYVKLTADREFDPKLQDRMMANLGATSAVEIESGHLPMLSEPRLLARVLNDFAATLQ